MVLINLLDWRYQLRRKRLILLTTYLCCYLFIVISILFILFSYFNHSNQRLAHSLKQHHVFQTNLQIHLNKVNQQQTLYQTHHDTDKYRLVTLLTQLIALLPQHIWLNHLSINHNHVVIKGATPDYLALIKFQRIIDDNQLVNSSRIQNLHQQSDSLLYVFNFVAEL